jgi:NDP-sugar pyrophosphorylase family protein
MDVVGVVLAAGTGSRLGPLGEGYPKAALPVANMPLITHHLRLLSRLGVRRAFVVVGHHAERVERALGNTERDGLDVQFVRQPAPLGSAHALASIRTELRTAFLVLLGDYYFVAGEPEVMLQRLARGESAIAVKREPEVRLVREACAVETGTDGRVLAIVEKPTQPRTDLKGCGFYALVPEALDAVARTPRTALRDEYELTVSLELFIGAGNPLYAEDIIDWDCNVTRPADLLECNLSWLDRHGVSHLVAERAFVSPDAELRRTVVGEGAAVRGLSYLTEVVVFPGTEVSGGCSVERTLLTPEGPISCGPTPQRTGKG